MVKLMKILYSTLFLGILIITDCVRARIVSTPKYIFNSNGLGAYSFEFETDDGTFRKEEGGSSPVDGSLVVRGKFGYIDSRGYLYTVRYIADSNGYQTLSEEDTRYNDRKII